MKQLLAGWFGQTQGAQALTALLTRAERAEFIDLSNENGFLLAQASAVIQQDEIWLALLGAPATLTQDRLQGYLAAYRQEGVEFLKQLTFGFALALLDHRQQTLLLATDRIGQRPIYFHQGKTALLFGASADQVRVQAEVSEQISEQALYDYVYFHHCPSPGTIYRAIEKLEGGQVLLYRAGQVTRQYYWLPEFVERPRPALAEAGEQLKTLLIQSVRNLTADTDQTGAFLSGGLDSSSVAGALAAAFPSPAKTFSMGFNAEGYDEIEYARIAARHFQLESYEYYVTPADAVAAIPLIAAHYDEPFGNSSALAAYYCARFARDHGVTALLAGDGGDELFAGNERYARQLLFEPYARLPGWARSVLAGLAPQLPSGIGLLHKAKRYLDQARAPLPDRLQDYNFLNRHAPAEIFGEDFLLSVDPEGPLRNWRETYQRPPHASALNRMLYLDWKFTLHDNDLVKVNKTCELAGVAVHYPMLDGDIIDLSCRIPSDMKLKPGRLRWFYKQAMQGFLPEKILNKSKHGFGLPFGVWLKEYQPLREMAYDNLQDLKKRPYFLPEFIDHAIAMHQSVHAAYYGELIWILMMLELWFKGKNR